MQTVQVFSAHIIPKWLAIQRSQFCKHTNVNLEFATTAIQGSVVTSKDMARDHVKNLNQLITGATSKVAVACDSDAFPVGEWFDELGQLTRLFDFVAVQRLEHHIVSKRERPHPLFVMWRPKKFRLQFILDGGRPTVKGWQDASWYPLRRVNVNNVDPLLCGLYGTGRSAAMIYHHGFGSRRISGYDAKFDQERNDAAFWSDPDGFISWLNGGVAKVS